MTKTALHLFAASLVATATACDRNSGQPAPSGSAPVGAVSVPAPASAAAEADYRDEDLPVPPDFEQEAEQTIDEANAADVLAEIERELDAGAPDAGLDAGVADAGADKKGSRDDQAPSGKGPAAGARAAPPAKAPGPASP